MKCAVYRHKTKDGITLYIGQSRDPVQRSKGHKLKSSWWRDDVTMEVTWYASREDAMIAEAIGILREKPKGNKSVPLRLIAETFFPVVAVRSWRGEYTKNPYMEDDARTVRREIVMTEDEAREIDAAAKSEGLKCAPFMRLAALRLARKGHE